MRYLWLALSITFLASCASVAKVERLPPGSSVVVVSGLDNVINFEYIGSTEYMNSAYQYKAPELYPDASFIYPIESSLRKSGYQVTVKHVPANSPITALDDVSHRLNYKEYGYLHKILRGQHPDRVIIIAKAPVNDINFPKEHIAGYGFLQREGSIYRGTQVYGALSIRVIDLRDHQEFETHLAYIGDQVPNNMFATSRLDVHPWAIKYFDNWMQTKFAPNIIGSLRDKKILLN